MRAAEQYVQGCSELSVGCVWGMANKPVWLEFGLCGKQWQKPRMQRWKRPIIS